jgi:hypothetical protein
MITWSSLALLFCLHLNYQLAMFIFRLALAWLSPGFRLAFAWHSPGFRLAFAWHSPGIRPAFAWHGPRFDELRSRLSRRQRGISPTRSRRRSF